MGGSDHLEHPPESGKALGWLCQSWDLKSCWGHWSNTSHSPQEPATVTLPHSHTFVVRFLPSSQLGPVRAGLPLHYPALGCGRGAVRAAAARPACKALPKALAEHQGVYF